MIRARSAALFAMFVVLAAALAACGSSGNSAPTNRDASLVLDFTPNAIHAGIYSAITRGYDAAEGVHLHVIAPSASTDAIKLLETGSVNFAILDIHDLAIARERHQDIVGIMAIVEHPLAAVIAAPQIHTPRQLQGRTVGVTGDPSDLAVLHSVLDGAHADPHKVKTITIGFNAVAALLSHRVAAATAFWNDEGVTLAHDRPGFHSFRVDQYGAPAYPELVLCATASSLRSDPSLARSVVRALVRGYDFTLKDPEVSEANLEQQVQSLDPRLVAEQLNVELPAFTGPDHVFGELDPATLRRWAQWELKFGIVSRMPDVSTMFDSRFLPKR